jgi:very-short-patch-repair endonuclease
MATRYLRYRTRLKPRARSLRLDPTPAERKLWFEYLRGLPQKFTRQKPVGSYIVDFYCASHALAVEVDGDSHYTDHGESHDRVRTEALSRLGVRVLRFTNADVQERFEAVCDEIGAQLLKG